MASQVTVAEQSCDLSGGVHQQPSNSSGRIHYVRISLQGEPVSQTSTFMSPTHIHSADIPFPEASGILKVTFAYDERPSKRHEWLSEQSS